MPAWKRMFLWSFETFVGSSRKDISRFGAPGFAAPGRSQKENIIDFFSGRRYNATHAGQRHATFRHAYALDDGASGGSGVGRSGSFASGGGGWLDQHRDDYVGL